MQSLLGGQLPLQASKGNLVPMLNKLAVYDTPNVNSAQLERLTCSYLNLAGGWPGGVHR